jgi:hypothetical protein
MKKILIISITAIVTIFLGLYGYYYFNYKTGKAWPKHDDPEKVGYVPNEETAIKVAEALWLPLYGTNIYSHRPFKATLQDSVWFVKGTLDEGARGGVPYAEIQKKDCKVIRLYHTR